MENAIFSSNKPDKRMSNGIIAIIKKRREYRTIR
jgi:hypothetical protein